MDYSTIGTPMGNSERKKCSIGKTGWRNMSHMLKDYYKAIEALRIASEWIKSSKPMDEEGVTEGRIRQNTAQAAVDKAIFDFEITEAGAGDR